MHSVFNCWRSNGLPACPVRHSVMQEKALSVYPMHTALTISVKRLSALISSWKNSVRNSIKRLCKCDTMSIRTTFSFCLLTYPVPAPAALHPFSQSPALRFLLPVVAQPVDQKPDIRKCCSAIFHQRLYIFFEHIPVKILLRLLITAIAQIPCSQGSLQNFPLFIKALLIQITT